MAITAKPSGKYDAYEYDNALIAAWWHLPKAEKMVRGCEWKIAKRLVEPPYSVQVHFVHEQDVPDSIWQIVEKSDKTYSIGSYFRVQRAVAHDDPLVVFYRIEFWGNVRAYAFIDKEH